MFDSISLPYRAVLPDPDPAEFEVGFRTKWRVRSDVYNLNRIGTSEGWKNSASRVGFVLRQDGTPRADGRREARTVPWDEVPRSVIDAYKAKMEERLVEHQRQVEELMESIRAL